MKQKLLLIPFPQMVKENGLETEVSVLSDAAYIHDPALDIEEYKILISVAGAQIWYGDAQARFRAETTCRQIAAGAVNGKVPCVEIHDYPDIKKRGLMIDISRGKMPVLAELKKLIDLMAELKYNQLQLYMDNFVFAYPNFPDFWKDAQPYTAAEIKELQDYCRDRFIELIPNQNGFGHMEHWLAKKELAELGIIRRDGGAPSTLNPLDPQSIKLMNQIYAGFLDLFESKYVHIGMDEPFDLGQGQTEELCKKMGIGWVYTEYLNKICRLIKEKYKKIPMFWDDIVFKHAEELMNIPQDVIAMEWGYEGEQHFDRNCERLRQAGMRFYVCPGTSSWGSYTGRFNNMVFNVSAAAECGAYYGADGFLLTDWGDGGHPQFPVVSLFPYVFGAACSWNCVSPNTEEAYGQRQNLITCCEQYLDQFIFQIGTKKSLSRLVNAAGNYYLLEEHLVFNGTQLNREFLKAAAGRKPDMDVQSLRRVEQYIHTLMEELSAFWGNTYAEEAMLNCSMVSVFAKGLLYLQNGQEGQSVKTALAAVSKEFERLWQKKNKRVGMEIFLGEIKRFQELMP